MGTAASIGSAIRARRLKLGLTQPQLAERTHGAISQGVISKWETGGTEQPGVIPMAILAKALETTIEELFADLLSPMMVGSPWRPDPSDPNYDDVDSLDAPTPQVVAVETELRSAEIVQTLEALATRVGNLAKAVEMLSSAQGVSPRARRQIQLLTKVQRAG